MTPAAAVMAIAAVVASLSGVIGLYVSFYWEIPPGPAIVLTCTAFFLIVVLLLVNNDLYFWMCSFKKF